MLSNLVYLIVGCLLFGSGVFVGYKIWGNRTEAKTIPEETIPKQSTKKTLELVPSADIWIPNDELEAIEEEQERQRKQK